MKASRRILKNMFSLTVAEFANKGIIFIFNAYLARVILPEGFGVIGFANAFTAYFLLIVNLGFNPVGVREIAKSPGMLNKYVNSITTIKLILSVIAYAGLFASTIALNKPEIVKYIILVAGVNLFANAILLDWVYQGTERMEFLAVRQVITSLLNLIGIILLVHNQNDVVIAMVVIVISTVLNSIWMLMLYIKMFGKIRFELDFPFIKTLMKSSIPIALSVFSAIILNTLNIIILGLYRSDFETGIYNAAYKFLLLGTLPLTILQNTFFPLISRSLTIEERQRVMQKFTMLMFLFGSIVAFGTFTFSDFIVRVSYGSNYNQASIIIKLLSITMLIVYYNVSNSVPLNGWNKEKSVALSILLGAIVNIILNFLLIPKYGAEGAAYATIMSEFVVGVGLTVFFVRTLKTVYILNLLKFSLFALVACGSGYILMEKGLHTIFAGTVTVIIFILINMIFKTVTIRELKGYFSK